MSYHSVYKGSEIDSLLNTVSTTLGDWEESCQQLVSAQYSVAQVAQYMLGNIDEFYTTLSQKIDGQVGLINEQITSLSGRIDTLVGESASEAIDTFREIELFLQGVTDTQTLTGMLQEQRTQINAEIDRRVGREPLLCSGFEYDTMDTKDAGRLYMVKEDVSNRRSPIGEVWYGQTLIISNMEGAGRLTARFTSASTPLIAGFTYTDGHGESHSVSIPADGCLSVYFPKGVTSLNFSEAALARLLEVYNLPDTSDIESFEALFNISPEFNKIDASLLDVHSATSIKRLFRNCPKLEKIDVSDWDVSNVTDMFGVFYNTGVSELAVEKWDVSNVSLMDWMFGSTPNLTSLDLSSWNVSNVTSMANMFKSSGLTSLDLSGWNAEKLTTMESMFENSTKLTTLKLRNWNSANVKILQSAFYGCNQLVSIDTLGWQLAAVTTLSSTFNGCRLLQSLDLSSWDVSKVTTAWETFYGCSALQSLDLSNWNMPNNHYFDRFLCGCQTLNGVFDMSACRLTSWVSAAEMFRNCRKLHTIRTPYFGGDVTNVHDMFNGCTVLNTLYVPRLNIRTNGAMENMFYGCSSLENIIGEISGIWDSLDMRWSPLTAESAMVIINGLSTVTTTKTLTLKGSTYDSLSEEQIAIATDKGWTVARY